MFDVESWTDVVKVKDAIEPCFPGRIISSADTKPWLNSGGASGDVYFLNISFVEENDASSGEAVDKKKDDEVFVLKLTKPERVDSSKAMGLAREGCFLSEFSPSSNGKNDDPLISTLRPLLPQILYSRGSMDDGRKVVVMERIDGVNSGYFFGAGNPNNHGINLKAMTAGLSGVDEATVVSMTMHTAALLHSKHWNDKKLLGGVEQLPGSSLGEYSYLRGRDWYLGRGRKAWEATINQSRNRWAALRPKIDEHTGLGVVDANEQMKRPEYTVKWGNLFRLLDASFAKATFERFQKEDLPSRGNFSMVHGDFHPANFLVTKTAPPRLVLVDWEVVGVGSGPQELGQYFISHSSPASRRALYANALEQYTNILHANMPEGEKAKFADKAELKKLVVKEYIAGGLGRWLWFLPLLTMFFDQAGMQFFVDQVNAFLDDHPVDENSVPMPRA